MAYTIPPQYRSPIDWERMRNFVNGYPLGYRPAKTKMQNDTLLPVEYAPIPTEESIPPVTYPEGQSLDYLNYGNDSSLDQFKAIEGAETSSTGIGTTGGGMSKNPMAYLQAVGDLASFGMDIYNSTRSQITLPAYTNYHQNKVGTLSEYNAMKRGPMYDIDTIHKPTIKEAAVDTVSKAAKGAMDGLSVGGPWGALAGAVIGLGAGIGNAAAKEGTYKRDVAKANRFNDIQRNNYYQAQRQALGQIQNRRNMALNYQRYMNTYGLGGTVEPSELMSITRFAAGGTHEDNPNGGVQIGVGENGQPNLVEEGEVRWNDFIFSKRVKPTEDVLKKYNTFMRGGYESYADLANKILELHKEREDSPYDKAAMQVQMQRLADAQEWQKLVQEATDNGMSPEEYIEYQQYMQSQGMIPEGNQFKKGGGIGGGDTEAGKGRKFRNGKGQDGMPIHGKGTRAYYLDNKGGSAYYMDKYLDALLATYYGNNMPGLMYDKDGKLIHYSFDDMNWYGTKVKDILTKDPDAVYYLYNRMQEINKGYGNGAPASPAYNMGYIMYNLDIPQYEFKIGKYYDNTPRQTILPQTSYLTTGPYGGVGFVPQINMEEFAGNQAKPFNSLGMTIQAEIDAYNKQRQQQQPNTYAKGGPYKSANNYQGDAWTNYLKYRDTVEGAIEDFIKQNSDKYGKYSTATILKNLTDNKWGPITTDFLNYADNRAKLEAETATQQQPITTTTETEEEPETQKRTATQAYAAENGNTDTAGTTTTPNFNRLGLSPYDSMRLAPVFDSLRSVLEQNAPDYTYADQLALLYRPVSYRPTGQYARFQPIDQHYLDTMANQQRNTMYGLYRQNAQSPTAANYYATLASTIANSQAAKMYRDSILQNNQSRNGVLQYNNQLDAANETSRQQIEDINYRNWMNIMAQSYAAAEQEKLAVEQAREANKQNHAANLGLVGRELSDRWYVSRNPALLYGPMGDYYKYLEQNV